jgi:hypothetical protein
MSTKRPVWVAATLDTKRDEAEYVTGLLETAGLSVALADMFRTLQYGNAEISRLQADPGFLKLRIELEDRSTPVRCKAHGKPHTHQFFALHPPHCLTVQLHVVCV